MRGIFFVSNRLETKCLNGASDLWVLIQARRRLKNSYFTNYRYYYENIKGLTSEQ